MRKLRLLTAMVVLLVIINTGLLFFLWAGKLEEEGRPMRGNAGDYLVKELHLNEAQTRQYDSLRRLHHEAVSALQQEERKNKEAFFATLGSPVTDSVAIELMARKNGTTIAMQDKITYYHFRQVREMLTPTQQQKFDAVIQDALRMMQQPLPGDERGIPPPGSDHNGPPPAP